MDGIACECHRVMISDVGKVVMTGGSQQGSLDDNLVVNFISEFNGVQSGCSKGGMVKLIGAALEVSYISKDKGEQK